MRAVTLLLASPLVLASPLPPPSSQNDIPSTLRHDLIVLLGQRLRINDWAAHSQSSHAPAIDHALEIISSSLQEDDIPEETEVLRQLEADLLPELVAAQSSQKSASSHSSPEQRTPLEVVGMEVPIGHVPQSPGDRPCHTPTFSDHEGRAARPESRSEILIAALVFAFIGSVLLVESLIWLKKRIQAWNAPSGAIRLPDDERQIPSASWQLGEKATETLAYGVENGEC